MDSDRIDSEEMMGITVGVTDIVVENESSTESPPSFKASAILYASSLLSICGGMAVILLEVLNRQTTNRPDTFIEMLEWNPVSQIGLIGILMGMFHFWLGLMIDRRKA